MNLAELLNKVLTRGVRLYCEDGRLRYRGPRGGLTSELRNALVERKSEIVALLDGDADAFRPLQFPAARYEPFPLTDLQQAYWIGEQEFYEHRAPAVFSQEYRLPALDVARFESAVRTVIAAHDICRLSVQDDGTQRIRERLPQYRLGYEDLRGMPRRRARQAVMCRRETMVNDLPLLSDGPPFSFFVQQLEHECRLHVALRLIAFDGVTTGIFFRNVAGCYRNSRYDCGRGDYSFRDYVLSLREYQRTPKYRESLKYWEQRLAKLPPAPVLPSRIASGAAPGRGFRRLQGRLSREEWQDLQARARSFGLPVNSVLCAIYVQTIRRWIPDERFTINLLVANRPPQIPALLDVLGNCSTTLLLEVAGPADSFVEEVKQLQRQLFADLEHNLVSGVEVIRLLQQRRTGSSQALMPIVFTSALDLSEGFEGFHLALDGAELTASSLHTPQVWLDQQVYEDRGDLVYNFDYQQSVYRDDLVADMFACYAQGLQRLCAQEEAWHAPTLVTAPESQLRRRQQVNSTAAVLPTGRLHSFFLDQVQSHGRRVAVCDGATELTYRELYGWSKAVEQRLLRAHVAANGLVAVLLPKGWRQVAAVLGVLQRGAAYLPIDVKHPTKRIQQILRQSGAVAVVTTEAIAAGNAAARSHRSTVIFPGSPEPPDSLGKAHRPAGLDDAAYVIYTSGSTGQPKGVVIGHRGAVNTIQDIVHRFEMDFRDRVFGVSSLGFDLSVFDIFGALSVGARLVLPAESDVPDPALWIDAIQRNGATVWNSVPALMEMLLDYLDDRAGDVLGGLRLVMLSGDWISPALVSRLRQTLPRARLVGLGGATEASIWSNYFIIDDLPDDWSSVPYGYPLSNQQLHVLDRQLQPAPDWVRGDLYIGGLGVAKGYRNDPQQTGSHFLTHPHTGARLYRTGDSARYRTGGIVEFLGRDDLQVKIRGFRIELAEVEAHLRQHPLVQQAVAFVKQDEAGQQQLVAFVVPVRPDAEVDGLRAFLAERLPDYMVPTTVQTIDVVPLTANAKIDRSGLASLASQTRPPADRTPPRDSTERRLAELWSRCLEVEVESVDSNFFGLGGNSLRAVRLMRAIEKDFEKTIPLSRLFRDSTIASQATYLRRGGGDESSLLVPLQTSGNAAILFLFHPAGGNLLCYRELAESFADHGIAVFGLRARDDGPAEAQADTLERMGSEYVELILRECLQVPILLGGWSMGAVLAYEASLQLRSAGLPAEALLLIDPWVGKSDGPPEIGEFQDMNAFLNDCLRGDAGHGELDGVSSLRPGERLRVTVGRLHGQRRLPAGVDPEDIERAYRVYTRNIRALRAYRPPANQFPGIVYRACKSRRGSFRGLEPFTDSRTWATDGTMHATVVELDEDHYSIITGDATRQIAHDMANLLTVQRRLSNQRETS